MKRKTKKSGLELQKLVSELSDIGKKREKELGEMDRISKILAMKDFELKAAREELEEANKILEIKVEARTRELKELADVLEEKVKKRTADLEKTRAALLNILEDVDEAKAVAEEERDKTLSIINNLADGLLVFDNGKKLVLVNPRAEDFFKFRAEDAEGKTISELEKFAGFKPLAFLLSEGPEEINRKELSLTGELSLEVSTCVMMSGEKKLGDLIILHDVTREKIIERMKTEFVSLAAHQLRTPLSAIKWTLKMLLDGDLGHITEEQRDFIGKTYQSNERIIALINDLLNVARIEEGRYLFKPVLTGLEELVQSLIRSHGGQAGTKKINIEFQKPEKELPQIMLDREKMGLALENLLENAIKYTPQGGTIIICLTDDGGEIKFSIKDTGIGIPADQQKRVFTKFFRGANVVRLETDGTGLGLFIAKNIVESHRGKIWFESDENKGATFHFTLPIKIKAEEGGKRNGGFDDFLKKF